MKTEYIKQKELNKRWFLIDANDKTLGRLSTKVSHILRGKNKVNFTAHMDMGDFVIIVNAEKVKLTGKKSENKSYFRHSGYPGGAKNTSIKLVKETNPEFVVINAVKGMLPHNRLGSKIIIHLKVYSGNLHPHSSQNPEKIEI